MRSCPSLSHFEVAFLQKCIEIRGQCTTGRLLNQPIQTLKAFHNSSQFVEYLDAAAVSTRMWTIFAERKSMWVTNRKCC